MKSFQLKMTRWTALALFALMFITLVVFSGYALHEVVHQAKKRMKALSRGVLAEIAAAEQHGDELTAGVFHHLDAGLRVLDPKGKMAYAVFDERGELVHGTADFTQIADQYGLQGESEELTIRGVDSKGPLGDLLSEWHFLLRNRQDGFTVLVTDREDYESVERFLSGFLVVVVLAGLLAIPCGYLLSRRILVPLALVQEAAAEVRQGNLQARIPVPATKDEIADLAHALNQTFADLETLLDGMRRFCADAAHELKTPLTALRGNLEVCLGKARSPEEYQTVLGESVAEIALLSAMVHDLLLLSVSGDRARAASFHELAPGAMFREVVGHLSPLADERGIRIVAEIDDSLCIVGDEMLLPRICYNLLDNALRFSPDNATVRVSWQRQDSQAVLTVADQGRGIAAEEQALIFERFYQVAESRSQGTGLGLAIVKWIAELHDGEVTVESAPGEGASFRVCFPVCSA